MEVNISDTAVVITDPQNDFLSEEGAAWPLVKEGVIENNTIENIETILTSARDGGFKVFISPHYYYPYDRDWKFGGTIEKKMHEIDMYKRKAPLSLEGFEGSGADWLERYKPLINADNVVITSPHKIMGPENNDLVLQLRKHGYNKVILAGMSANLCIEAHLRELIEQGFEVAVVKDATAAGRDPELGDGYEAALINFKYIANAVFSTEEAVRAMQASV
jgi:nicotinamidase-related amidase